MERNQPSRSSRRAGWIASLFGPLRPLVPQYHLPTHPHCTDGYVQRIRTPVQENNYTAQPTWCTKRSSMYRTMTAQIWFRLKESLLPVCSTTVSFHGSSVYPMRLIFTCGFPGQMLALICQPKKHELPPRLYDAFREPHVRNSTYRGSAPITISVPLNPKCGILVADVDPI